MPQEHVSGGDFRVQREMEKRKGGLKKKKRGQDSPELLNSYSGLAG